MKRRNVLALLLVFAVTEIFAADNSSQNKPSASSSATPVVANKHAPPPTARNPAAVAGKPRLTPNTNIRYSPPGFRSARPAPLAMTTRQPNYRAGQNPALVAQPRPALSQPAKRTNAVGNRPRTEVNRNSYAEALKRCRYDRHDHTWWRRHCSNIVVVTTGPYFLDAGYWYPAYGYDATYTYEYNGPIYTYGNLLPDQVIVNVQAALREIGYYVGPVNGSLGPATRAALGNFQRDYGLVITGAVDEATVLSLGLI